MGRHHSATDRSAHSLPRLALALGLLIAALATAAGLFLQWPSSEAPPVSPEFT